jgi:hypothetical protein
MLAWCYLHQDVQWASLEQILIFKELVTTFVEPTINNTEVVKKIILINFNF